MTTYYQLMPEECPPDGYTGNGSMFGVGVVAVIFVIIFILLNKHIHKG